MNSPKEIVYVVVPNWNGKHLLADCLHSLQKQNASCRIVVVDNGSTDGSADFVRAHFPQVRLITLPKNYGFSGGVNAGIKYALERGAHYIALFNNDAQAKPDWLAQLLRRLKADPRTGIATGKLLQLPSRKKIDSTGDQYSIWGLPFPRGRDETDHGQYEQSQPVPAATGGASLYRASMFEDVGFFDQDFFAYYEDVDISLRAQLRSWQIWYEPRAIAYHRLGATSGAIKGFARYHTIKNYYYLYHKVMPLSLYLKYLPRFWLANLLVVVNSLRRWQVGPLIRAYFRLLITLPKLFWKRWGLQHRRKLTAAEFDKLLYRSMPPTHKNLHRLLKRFSRT